MHLVCGGDFEEENGVITSPWFPNPYEDNKNCVYNIMAPLGKAIVLNFTDFEIEDDCDFDSLRIYDGIDSNSTLIGGYCGDEKPPMAISTMNHLHLMFDTDSSNTGRGFRAVYSFIDASTFIDSIASSIIFAKNKIHFVCRLWWCHEKTKHDHFTTNELQQLCPQFELQMDNCGAARKYNRTQIQFI